MKYGQTFLAQSEPAYAHYNINYDALKQLIKANTTRGSGQALAIPGQEATSLNAFEESFFRALRDNHQFTGMFMQTKALEIEYSLRRVQTKADALLLRCARGDGKKPMSQKRQRNLWNHVQSLKDLQRDIQSAENFIELQRVAFRKLLKKYAKWTGSRSLSERFHREVLDDPKSFTHRTFDQEKEQCEERLASLYEITPEGSEASTPNSSRRPSAQPVPMQRQQSQQSIHYWNEYDNGSEVDQTEFVYNIYPGESAPFPGSQTMALLFEKALVPVSKLKSWLDPSANSAERRSLLGHAQSDLENQTDAEDDIDASSNEFPYGYATHYATFASVREQRDTRARERQEFWGMMTCFLVSAILLGISAILLATGKRKLAQEVNIGALIGVAASLFTAALGLVITIRRRSGLSTLRRVLTVGAFMVVYVFNGILLVYIEQNQVLFPFP